MNYRTWSLFIAYLVISTVTFAQVIAKDSLMKDLRNTKTEKLRLEILTNLMDASRKEELLKYAKQLLQESKKVSHPYYKEISLTEILRYYVNNDVKDSVNYYLKIADSELTGENKENLISFMKMMLEVRVVCYIKGKEGRKITEKYLLKLNTNKFKSRLDEIATHYVLGIGYGFVQPAELMPQTLQNPIKHFKEVIRLTDEMPIDQSILYRPNTFYMLCNYSEGKERVKYAIHYLNFLNQYASTKEMKRRPYTNKRHLINAYQMLATQPKVLGKDMASKYYAIFLDLNKRYPEDANVTPLYEYIFTSYNYYSSIKDYNRALGLCDSMITILRQINYPDGIPPYMAEKIAIYDSLHNYKKAYEAYKEYYAIMDTARKRDAEIRVENLKMQDNVNKLIIEKNSLEVEKGKTEKILFMALFLLALSICIYTFFFLKRSKSLNKQLNESNHQLLVANEKVQESEKIKSSFIQNMCHEVRTPLNAINGFSELLCNDIDPNSRKEFTKIIGDNCYHLSTMMNNILEISRLDSNNEELPITPTNIYAICNLQMEKLKKYGTKENIDYKIEGDFENDIATTNQTYLGHIIGHLLNNANKFTRNGSITLAFKSDPTQKRMIISVSDTGYGIPEGKHEWIFERFTKTDEFIPGSGLGLYLCRLIAERMNARIFADPNYKSGARFILTLPF